MIGVKRLIGLSVLILLAIGGWYVMRPPAAAHLLISDVRAEDLGYGTYVTFRVENTGAPDRLIGADTPQAEDVRLIQPDGFAGAPIPSGGSPVLSLDGVYLELVGLTDVQNGQLIPLTLTFEKAGRVTVQAILLMQDICTDHSAHMGLGAPLPGGDPGLALDVQPDGDGWALRVKADGFTFNEELADGPHMPGVGHAHLYLDGLKLQRLYRRDAHIGALLPGRYQLRVTLSTNDHKAYVLGDQPIEVVQEIVVR